MAKREIRMVTASSDVAGIVDHGADIDTQIKNLTYEDKGFRSKVVEEAQRVLEDGELSVRLVGRNSAAVVSGVEKVELDFKAESFPAVRDAIDKGLLVGVVDRTLGIVVPPADIERAARVLQASGINATVTETLKICSGFPSVRPASTTDTVEHIKAQDELEKCLSREVTYRVKYERA